MIDLCFTKFLGIKYRKLVSKCVDNKLSLIDVLTFEKV